MQTVKMNVSKTVESLNSNELINLRMGLRLQYGSSYVNYNDKGDVSYRSPILANVRGLTFVTVTEETEVLFSNDIAYIADALEASNHNDQVVFTRSSYDNSWDESSDEIRDIELYYAMVLIPECNVWTYYGNIGLAYRLVASRREDEVLLSQLMR